MDRSIHEFDKLPEVEQGKKSAVAPAARAAGVGNAHESPSGKIGVIYNPRSHRNKGQDLDCANNERVLLAVPETRPDIGKAIADFAEAGISYLIINGGDGTVRDVLTSAVPIYGDDMPPIAVLPKGKTNALNVDIGSPKDWNIGDAIKAFDKGDAGRRITRRPLQITTLDGTSAPVRGFILGAGAFTLGTKTGQDAHNLGFFNSLAVGATGVWGMLQALFGSDSNPWRRGVEMGLLLKPAGTPVPHAGFGDRARRAIVLSSTLRRMPMGIKLYGPERDGLKLAVLDAPRRRVLAAVPMILAGWQSPWMAKNGYHQVDAEAYELEIGDQFILDGEVFPPGRYCVSQGPELTFVTE
ncbi:diacylglycerol kinase family protein [Erythrobacter sp. W53]|uniref:diacylglycerol kinase family protein n=1 Tax=Erythrobacter sp. W53 TaxID=3425947 RepID=UPI003D768CBC